MIVASAIRLSNGSVYVGKRHNDCFKNAIDINVLKGYSLEEAWKLHLNCEQGFITDKLEFLNREEAFIHAGKNGQLKNNDGPAYLTSEDLW